MILLMCTNCLDRNASNTYDANLILEYYCTVNNSYIYCCCSNSVTFLTCYLWILLKKIVPRLFLILPLKIICPKM